MEIKNLAQLKREIQAKRPFEIVRHYVRPEFEGQIRKPNVIQTNGFYSVILDDPDHHISQANGQKGSWIDYGKASDWAFEDGLCKAFDHRGNGSGERRPVWEIRFL